MNEPGTNETGTNEAGTNEPGPRLPRWALATWPSAWRERYGDELADTWAETGATRRAAVGIAWRGLLERVARPLPAGLAAVPVGPAWDVRPSWRRRGVIAGVAAVVLVVANALGVALLALADGRTGPDGGDGPTSVALLLNAVVALGGLVGGLRLAARPGFRSAGHGLAVGSVVFGLLPTLLIFPWPLLLVLVALVGRWGAGARHGTRRARLAAVVAGLYALVVVAAGAALLLEPLFSSEGPSFIGIWLIFATQPLSFVALALPLPSGALVPVLLACGAVQCLVVHRLVRGRRRGGRRGDRALEAELPG